MNVARFRIFLVQALFLAGTLASAAALPRVPDGYTVELVAGAEHVQHPMMGCFDDRGRLYVAESAGTNRRAADLLADPLDSIKVLEDADGDGRYEKSWTFADKLVFPQGCLWYRGAIYTCSSPYLWKLEDADGDGVCDRRTVLVKSFGFSGNAADIHGPFLSPDGRLYWCDGPHGHEIHEQEDGSVGGADDAATVKAHPEPGLPNAGPGELLTKGKAARIFSCRPDGSDLRVLCGGGMDNPVEVDFWETGECLGTVNLMFGKPRGDCLVHWVEGGVYPKENMRDCIAEFPWTGGLLEPVHNYGHVAVSGLCRYRSTEFGDLTQSPDRQGAIGNPSPDAAGEGSLPSDVEASVAPHTSLPHGRGSDTVADGRGSESGDRAAFFVTHFNTHKLVKTIVERHGSTFRAVESTDFLVSDDPDFHPTDVLEDADGSLLVIDTGGWFRIGCPTSQVAKPEIAGGIYRIRKVGAHRTADPGGTRIDWRQAQSDPQALLKLLGDHRPAVRERAREAAAELLSGHDDVAMKFCQLTDDQGSPRERVGFVGAAARAQRSIMAWHYIQSDPDAAVRMAALLARPAVDPTQPDSGTDHIVDVTVPRIASPDPAEARAAIESLGLLLERDRPLADHYNAAREIVDRLRQPGVDRTLEHAAIVALTRIADRKETARHLGDPLPAVQRAALIALDQMPEGRLTREEVLPLLATRDAVLRETVLDVISRRDGWGAATLQLFGGWLKQEPAAERDEIMRRFLAAQAQDAAIQAFIAESLARPDVGPQRRAPLLEAMETAEVAQWPEAWTPVLESLLAAGEVDPKLQALRIIGARSLTAFDPALRTLLDDVQQPLPVRVEALAVVAPRMERLTEEHRKFVSETLRSDADLLLRLKLAAAFAAAPLDDVQLCTAAGLTPALGPAFVPALWPAYEQATKPIRQKHVVAMLSELEELPGVSEQQLRSLLETYGEEARAEAAPLLARFQARDAAAKERVDRYLPWAEEGDAQRGRYVFFGQTAACSKCHRVGPEGAQIGPDLTKIATIRQPRDLVEAILLPSASFARDYHPYTAVTEDGRQVSGLISRETADAIVFRLTDLSEVRVPRADIEILAESQTSIMPQGLEMKLSEQDFRDLLAYLRSLK
jgi:putative heme-binding domain-containing protein